MRLYACYSCFQYFSLEETLSSYVLGFPDALWQILIAVNERKYLCATIIAGRRHKRKRKYVAFKCTAQGSSSAPLLWARTAALLMRLCQALFCTTQVKLMCYVDDPLAAMRGSKVDKMLQAATLMLVWEALGFGLAYPK